MKIKAVIFDFDGVICESVEVKTQAFRRLFAEYPQHLERIVQYHLDQGGMSRFRKFEYIYREILKEPLSSEKSKALGEKFSMYCYQGVLEAPFVAGVYEFLEQYHQKLKFFVVSGTPEEEMRDIVSARKLSRFFQAVYGSPRTKGELNFLILKQFNLLKEEVIFVGDSVNDKEGADEAGVVFVGRVPLGSFNPFLEVPASHLIKEMNELREIIESGTIRP